MTKSKNEQNAYIANSLAFEFKRLCLQATQGYGNQAIGIAMPLKNLNAQMSEIISGNC